MADRILLYCLKVVILWQLIYSVWNRVGNALLSKECPLELA